MKDTEKSEYYFIQFLFCKNWELLRKENRKLYDVMLFEYDKIFQDGKKQRVDVMDINKKFLAIFGL